MFVLLILCEAVYTRRELTIEAEMKIFKNFYFIRERCPNDTLQPFTLQIMYIAQLAQHTTFST